MSGLIRSNGMRQFEERDAIRQAFRRNRDGFVRNASPAVGLDYLAATPSGGKVLSLGSRLSQQDVFTLGADGAQTLTLTYQPVSGSENVALFGETLYPATEWTRSGRTLSLLVAAAALTGDELCVQYDYLAAAPLPIASPAQVNDSKSGLLLDPSAKVVLPAAAQAGDLAVIFLQYWSADIISNLSGYTNQAGGTATESGTNYSYTMRVLTKVITSATDAPSLSQSHGYNGAYIAVLIPGGAVATVAANTVQNQPNGGAQSTPAVSSGGSTVRCWMAVGNTPRIAGPPGTQLQEIGQNTTDMIATSDTNTGPVSTTATLTQAPYYGISWVLATVGVTS